jgi:hypothetical protein
MGSDELAIDIGAISLQQGGQSMPWEAVTRKAG